MYTMAWIDALGSRNQIYGTFQRCKTEFDKMVKKGSKGEIESALLFDPKGNVVDSWGT